MTRSTQAPEGKKKAQRAPERRAQRSPGAEPAGPSRDKAQLSAAYGMGPAHSMRSPVQAKLTVGQSGDRYEREADDVAQKVTSGTPAGDVSHIPSGGLSGQRQEDEGADQGAGAAQTKEDTEGAAPEAGSDADAQAKCDSCAKDEKGQRQEDEGQQAGSSESPAQAQREEDDAQETPSPDEGPQAQAQREPDSSEEGSSGGETSPDEPAQAKCDACEGGEGKSAQREAEENESSDAGEGTSDVQRLADDEADGAGSEGEGATDDSAQREGDGEERECGASETAGGEAQGSGDGAGGDEEGAQTEPAEGEEPEGEQPEEGAQPESAGDDLGCGEGGEGEEAEASPGGGQSCGGGAETAEAEGEASGGGGAEGGAGPTSSERPPAAGAPPACADPIEAASEEEGAEGGAEGGAAPEAGSEGGGECATAQREPDGRPGLRTKEASRRMQARGQGEPMPARVRGQIEGTLGVDLSGVRVHADGNAQAASRALRAKAFTSGNNIYLGSGQSPHDLGLMAHETTHVLQQDAIARRKPAEGEAPHDRSEGPSTEAAAPVAGVPARGDAPAKAGPAPAVEPSPAEGAPPSAAAPPPTSPPPPAAPPPSGAPAASAASPRRTTVAAATSAGSGEKMAGAPTGRSSRAPAPVTTRSIAAPDASSFTGEPSDSLAALSALSPVRAPLAYRQFKDGVGTSLERRRRGENADRPHARYQVRSPNLPDGPAEHATGPAAPNRAAAPGTAPGVAPANVPIASEDAGPAPAVDTRARAHEVDAVDEKKPNAIQRLRAWLASFLARLPTSDSNVNTDPGPAPALKDEVDPTQIEVIEDEKKADMAHGLEEADEERDDDFGEDEIEPEQEDGEAKIPVPAHAHEMGTGCDPEGDAESLAFDPPHEAELAARVHEETGPQFAAERDRLDAAESQRDRTIADERGQLPGRVADAHAAAYRQQDEAASAARAEVTRLRGTWGAENLGVQTRFEGASATEAGSERTQISGHAREEQVLVDRQHKSVKDEADGKRQTVEADAKREKEAAERAAESESSGSWFSRGVSWVKDQVKSALAWAADKIRGWFNELRAWVKKKFAELKQWINEKIEEFRAWVNERLEGLRRRLHALVDKYLGEYPAIAARFHRAIDTSIDVAQAAVNRAADGLKAAVNAVIDTLAKAVDTALAVVEKAAVWALTVACDMVVTGLNLVNVLVEGDLDSMIMLVRELPDWPPIFGGLMSLVRAGVLGFLERIKGKPADVKKRFVEKIRDLLTSGRYYAGVFLGILKGIVWDGLVGTIRMVFDIITGIPKIISDIYAAIKRLRADTEAIEAIADGIQATGAELAAFLDQPDAADQIVEMLKKSPGILVDMISRALHAGREWAYRKGASYADGLFSLVLDKSAFDIGIVVGSFIGEVIFEVILLVFTAGGGTAIKLGGRALQWMLKGLGELTKGLRAGGGLILKALNLVREVIMTGVKAAQALGGTLKKVFTKVGELVDRIVDWFRRAFGRVTRKLRKRSPRNPQQRREWLVFKQEVQIALAKHRDGIAKGALEGIYRGIISRHRAVVRWPTRIVKRGPHWRLSARPVNGVLQRFVAEVLLDRETRWKQGKKAVKKAIDGLKRTHENIDASMIARALIRVRGDYHYTELETRFDPAKNEFLVEGAMSRKKPVVKATPKRPLTNVEKVHAPSQHVQVNPLVHRTRTRSAPSGAPPNWDEVQKIRSKNGRTSLYKQGHLVSGYFLHGEASNLTPITSSANTNMALRAETPIRKKLPTRPTAKSSAPIFDYEAKVSGVAAGGRLLERTLREDDELVCREVPAERNLHQTITISIRSYGYNQDSHRWDRSVPLPKAARPSPVDNVPPFPPGQPCPKPRKPKKRGKRK